MSQIFSLNTICKLISMFLTSETKPKRFDNMKKWLLYSDIGFTAPQATKLIIQTSSFCTFFIPLLTCILIWWSCERFIPKNDEINPKLKNIKNNKHSVHDIWLSNRVSKMFSIVFQFCSLRNSQISWVLFSTVYILATSKSHLYT